jgi:uncharacterized protein (TIGR00290 family)
MDKIPVILFWSGGKDCSYTLYELFQDERYEVISLISTFNGNYNRLSMHGVREDLIDMQAKSIGIPLYKVYVYEGNNIEYEEKMNQALLQFKERGVQCVAFGDIFLEDLRAYREKVLDRIGMLGLFPIWKKDTRFLLRDFIDKGFVSHTCCVNDNYLSKEWVGRRIDDSFLQELPSSVDCCGENGEFHTFCSKGPIYQEAIEFAFGEMLFRPIEDSAAGDSNAPSNDKPRGFWYCDLIPVKK